MDFLVGLPPFMGYIDVLVTVDCFSKAAHLGFYGRTKQKHQPCRQNSMAERHRQQLSKRFYGLFQVLKKLAQ